MQLSDRTHQIFAELRVYPSSVTQQGELIYALAKPKPGQRQLVILAPPASCWPVEVPGESRCHTAVQSQWQSVSGQPLMRSRRRCPCRFAG